jgi:DNA-binding FadR family transcriptional regulator
VEPEIAALAVRNASETDIREIGEILQRMKSESYEDDTYSFEIDTKFHMKIAEAAGNAVLFNMMQYIMHLIHERLWKDLIDGPDVLKEDLVHDLEFHEGIFECLQTKDEKRVRMLMLQRFNEIQKRIE